jgi:3-oxoacyl-[acyl-carrier protein] reductase
VQGSFEQLGDDQWRRAVDGGVMGMVHCVRSALPLLRKAHWARIVNFSAQSTQRQSPNLVAYTAAKAMVTSISKNLSQLLAPDEIMVNVVSPGSIASEALVGWAGSVGVDGSDPYALMTAIGKHFGHPAHVPRAGLPDEVGSVVAFLASRRNSYTTRSTHRSAAPTATTSTGTPTGPWCGTASPISDIRCCGSPAVWPSSGR